MKAVLFAVLCSLSVLSLAEAGQQCFQKVIDCKALTRAQCSDEVLTALGHNGTTMKLKADTPTDTVHGYVSIEWHQPPLSSTICVTHYDKDEASNGKHQSTFKKHSTIPSAKTMQTGLDALVIP